MAVASSAVKTGLRGGVAGPFLSTTAFTPGAFKMAEVIFADAETAWHRKCRYWPQAIINPQRFLKTASGAFYYNDTYAGFGKGRVVGRFKRHQSAGCCI